jgi:triphosphatase
MDTEIELKFLLSENEMPLIPGLIMQFAKTVKNKPAKNLKNAYFDTPNRELRALDIGLRTRCSDAQCEQTIKLAGQVIGGLHQRPEYNLPLDTPRPNLLAFQQDIWPHGMQITAINDTLFPIFSTNFIRRTWLIETEQGSEIEVVLDKGEIAAQGQVEPISELEIELVKGERSDLFLLADHLVAIGGLRMGLYSKAARGYRLADDKPLKANQYIGVVPLKSSDTQEKALVKCVNFGIEFVQKHEQCYFNKPSLKTLKRVIDGINLIKHAFKLFNTIIVGDLSERLLFELSWLLEELSWVEDGIHLKTYTSKRHAYYKKIKNAEALSTLIAELKLDQPSVTDIEDLFHSPRYNRLILSLTRWLVDKTWRQEWGQQTISAAEQPIKEVAQQAFENDWQKLQVVTQPKVRQLNTNDYLALRAKLDSSLLSGNCLGALYDNDTRQAFRTPWIDIAYGIYELETLAYLKSLCEKEALPELDEIEKWLEKKAEFLVQAMEQSRQATLNSLPYWR